MFIVLDLETTGLSHREDSIIEYACVKIDRKTFQEVDRITSFIHPDRDIPELISQITNIFDDDVIDAPNFSEKRGEIQEFIGGYPIIGHNVQFDIKFLEAGGVNLANNPSIDTFFLANFLCLELKSLNLGYLCEYFGIELLDAHRAIDDTIATVKLFQKLVERWQGLDEYAKEVISYFLVECQDTGVKILNDEYGQKRDKDLFFDKCIEKYIQALRKNKIPDLHIHSSKNKLDLVNILENIKDFELRENQKNMLTRVDQALIKGEKHIIEAPTGIGKTFAYLLPALKHSLRFEEAVHISTSTKALQDQIYYKDLIFLQKIFPESFSFTKLKGKKNYLGISSFLDFIQGTEIFTSTKISYILKIWLWSGKTEFGELEELDFFGEEWSYLHEINAGNSYTFDVSNIYSDVEFAVRARKNAKNSNIIITNNHILFQDMTSEGSLLGGVKNLILDEAHALEDVVTNSLKKSLSYQFIHNTFEKIEKKIHKLQIKDSQILHKKQYILFDSAELFSVFESAIFEKFSYNAKYKILSLDPVFFSKNTDIALLSEKLLRSLEEMLGEFQELSKKELDTLTREIQDIKYITNSIQNFCFDQNFEETIYYLTHDEKRGTEAFMTVLRPGKFLREYLWNTLESVVLTSATLQMGGDFSYIHSMLYTHDFQTMILDSDFDYDKQALVFIPQDLGDVKNNIPELLNFFEKFFFTVRGKTLVLLTAFSVIREIFSAFKIKLQKQDIHLLAQSISGSKNKQIDFFKTHSERSILLGTDTFWEGIDIPGQDLQYLIVHKIPFAVPTDPIFIARSKLFIDSFQDYAIPKSILKLKQGFGRLIRSKTDTGIIIFLDNRISTTLWGKRFIEAFPKEIKIRYGESNLLIDLISKNT